MKRLAVALGAFAFALCLSQQALSTVGWAPVNSRTIQGDWVCLDHVTGDAFRLKANKDTMVLAVTNGPRAVEFLLRGPFSMKDEKIFSLLKEANPQGASVFIEAKGIATNEAGKLTVRLVKPEGFFASWLDTELIFVKEGKESVAERLCKNDQRARALIEGTSMPTGAATGGK